MSSPRFTNSPNRSKAKGDLTPLPQGQEIVTRNMHLTLVFVHNPSTAHQNPVDKCPQSVNTPAYLSTETVDNSPNLWIKMAPNKTFRSNATFAFTAACG